MMQNKIVYHLSLFCFFLLHTNQLFCADVGALDNLAAIQGEKCEINILVMPNTKVAVPMDKNNFTFEALIENALKCGTNLNDYLLLYAGREIEDGTSFSRCEMDLKSGDKLYAAIVYVLTISDQYERIYQIKLRPLSIAGVYRTLSRKYDGVFVAGTLQHHDQFLSSDADLKKAYEESNNARLHLSVITKTKEENLNEWGSSLAQLPWNSKESKAPILPMASYEQDSIKQDFLEFQDYESDGREMAEISNNFFIGNLFSILTTLTNAKLRSDFKILDFSCDKRVPPFASQRGGNHTQIKILDTFDKFPELLQAFDDHQLQKLIDEALMANKKVLIACQMGQSRSVTIAMVYFMKRFGLSAIQAFQIIKKERDIASPNAGFLSGLLELEQQLLGASGLPANVANDWLKAPFTDPLEQHFEIVQNGETTYQFKALENSMTLGDLLSVLRLANVAIEKTRGVSNFCLEITFAEDFTAVQHHVQTYQAL